jgi:hypothetical protein
MRRMRRWKREEKQNMKTEDEANMYMKEDSNDEKDRKAKPCPMIMLEPSHCNNAFDPSVGAK